MSSDKTKKWIKAAGVRAVKTMAQTAVSLITVGNLITELDWVSIIGISATAGILLGLLAKGLVFESFRNYYIEE